MAFERKSMEAIVDKMISWAQGVSTLTDFRIGSKNRTFMESVAVVIEEFYDKVFRALKELIERNIYAVIGFDKSPATYASGNATFGRGAPADQNYFISAGTTLATQATQYSSPLKFYTAQDAILAVGTTSVDVPVVCEKSGTTGNISAGALTTFIQKPLGIETVTNASNFTTGKDEETPAEQKSRFQGFMDAQARGVLQAIEYGAKLANITDSTTGIITESVKQAFAYEDLPARKGEIDVYLWNGVGSASANLQSEVAKILEGYYDSDGNPVYGYKSAGIMVNIYSATIKYVTIRLDVTSEAWSTLDALQATIESEVDRYFGDLKMGETAIQSALEANVKYIEGVKDVKLYFSTDSGATWGMGNITAETNEIIVVQKPLVYA